MGKVLAHTTMSLDGFIAGPNDEMDWVFEYADDVPAELVDEVIATTGAILGGRRGYEVGRKAEREETGGPFGGRWSGPIFILTHRPPAEETDPAYTFLSGEIAAAVEAAREAAGEGNLLVLGADVVGQCLRADLIDELLIHLLPVLLGDGVRLFGDPGVARRLETVAASATGQVVNLRYRVAPGG
jgi:dihydrofolate reductase